MRFREHKNDRFAESMETVVEFHDRASLARHLRSIHADLGPFYVTPLFNHEPESGWSNVHALRDWRGQLVGYTDGPLPDVRPF